jgi:membrane protein DedA with SNARE-associated domain
MSSTTPAPQRETSRQPVGSVRFRGALLGLALARGGVSALAIPLVPLLWRDHFLSLVLLRPTKEVLLAAGFGIRLGNLQLPLVALASIPLMVLGVWLFFALGRAFADDVHERDLPGLAGRMLPRHRIFQLSRVLDRKGPKVVFLGRLAVFPSSMMAAAAGASGMRPGRFLVADGLGALAALSLVVGLGYGLGEAYERGGIWLTGLGLAVAAGLLVALGRWLRADGQDGGGA